MRWALRKTGLRFSEPVLTPQADDLHLVLGPVVTARRYPITAWSKVTGPRSYLFFAYDDHPREVSGAARNGVEPFQPEEHPPALRSPGAETFADLVESSAVNAQREVAGLRERRQRQLVPLLSVSRHNGCHSFCVARTLSRRPPARAPQLGGPARRRVNRPVWLRPRELTYPSSRRG